MIFHTFDSFTNNNTIGNVIWKATTDEKTNSGSITNDFQHQHFQNRTKPNQTKRNQKYIPDKTVFASKSTKHTLLYN